MKERHEFHDTKAWTVKLQDLWLCGNCNAAINIGRVSQYNVIVDYLYVYNTYAPFVILRLVIALCTRRRIKQIVHCEIGLSLVVN